LAGGFSLTEQYKQHRLLPQRRLLCVGGLMYDAAPVHAKDVMYTL